MGQCMAGLVNKLVANNELSDEELTELLKYRNKETTEYLFEQAMVAKQKYYGDSVYIRGTIELTNYCKNECFYCGLKRDNIFIPRYRLDEEDVMKFADYGYERGVRTFSIMGGDDYNFTQERITGIIHMLTNKYPDVAIELSLGQRDEATYRAWFDAGATRYVLCHETADDNHFKKLHPAEMSLLRRKQCLWELKDIGYQVGTGFMVGVPFQMINHVVDDLKFIKQLEPQIVRISPFVPSEHTIFAKERSGNGDMTMYLMAIIRLMLPRVIITADQTLENVMADGRKKAISASANEVLASISTEDVREYYYVYNKRINRKSTAGDEIERMRLKITESGSRIGNDKGDYNYPPEEHNYKRKYEKKYSFM